MKLGAKGQHSSACLTENIAEEIGSFPFRSSQFTACFWSSAQYPSVLPAGLPFLSHERGCLSFGAKPEQSPVLSLLHVSHWQHCLSARATAPSKVWGSSRTPQDAASTPHQTAGETIEPWKRGSDTGYALGAPSLTLSQEHLVETP